MRPDHGAFDEQPVDPTGIVDRIGQATARLEIQRECAGAEVDVEIEQRRGEMLVRSEIPAERGRQRRGADTAAGADDRGRDVALDHFDIAAARGAENRLRLIERVAQRRRGKRLEEVVVDSACEQIAVEPHIIDLPDGDHHGARFANLGQRIDIVERVAAFRQIDEQDVGAGTDRERLDRVAQTALVAFLRRPAEFDDHRTQHVERILVADIGGERVAVVAGHAGFPRCIHGLFSSGIDFGKTFDTGRHGCPIGLDRLGRSRHNGFAGTSLTRDQVFGIGDHGGKVRIHPAAEARRGRIVVI